MRKKKKINRCNFSKGLRSFLKRRSKIPNFGFVLIFIFIIFTSFFSILYAFDLNEESELEIEQEKVRNQAFLDEFVSNDFDSNKSYFFNFWMGLFIIHYKLVVMLFICICVFRSLI